MELFDTHCHIQSAGTMEGERLTRELWAKAENTNPDAIIERAAAAGVTRLICVGCDVPDSELVVRFVRERRHCWAAVGIHPHEASRYEATTSRDSLNRLVTAPRVVAVGECGLDYRYTHSPKAAQHALLRLQIEMALQHNLPLIFHVREAFDDFWPIFKEYHSHKQPVRGVLHSFTDSTFHLEQAVSYGLFIGVNGIATFTKDTQQQALYQAIPLDHLLLETDAPFLTPAPYRGKICESYHVRTIAEFLASHRGETLASIAAATTRNARQLFGV